MNKYHRTRRKVFYRQQVWVKNNFLIHVTWKEQKLLLYVPLAEAWKTRRYKILGLQDVPYFGVSKLFEITLAELYKHIDSLNHVLKCFLIWTRSLRDYHAIQFKRSPTCLIYSIGHCRVAQACYYCKTIDTGDGSLKCGFLQWILITCAPSFTQLLCGVS